MNNIAEAAQPRPGHCLPPNGKTKHTLDLTSNLVEIKPYHFALLCAFPLSECESQYDHSQYTFKGYHGPSITPDIVGDTRKMKNTLPDLARKDSSVPIVLDTNSAFVYIVS